MKLLTYMIVIMITISLGGTGVNALKLEVDESLREFASEAKLLEEELELLRDPFTDYRVAEEPAEPEPAQPAAQAPASPVIGPPPFSINGVSKSGDNVVLIIDTGNVPEMLRSGESLNGYQFARYEDGEAIFVRNGREFSLQVGGGA